MNEYGEIEYTTITFDRKLRETDKAVLYLDHEGSVWVPKSLINDVEQRTLSGIDVEVPLWWAEQEGLI